MIALTLIALYLFIAAATTYTLYQPDNDDKLIDTESLPIAIIAGAGWPIVFAIVAIVISVLILMVGLIKTVLWFENKIGSSHRRY